MYNDFTDGRNAVIIHLLHAVLKSNSRKVTKNKNGASNVSKGSIKDSQMSFLFFAKTVSEVESHIINMKSKGKPIQPFLIATGDSIFEPKQFLVYFDTVKYQFKTFLKSLDICFKFFFYLIWTIHLRERRFGYLSKKIFIILIIWLIYFLTLKF